MELVLSVVHGLSEVGILVEPLPGSVEFCEEAGVGGERKSHSERGDGDSG